MWGFAEKAELCTFTLPFVMRLSTSRLGDGCQDTVDKVGDGYVSHVYSATGDFCVRIFPAQSHIGSGECSLDHIGWLYEETIEYGALEVLERWWRPLRSLDTRLVGPAITQRSF
jgi:hypothetical protein